MGDLDEPRSGGNRRALDPFDAEQVPGDGRPDDIGDRIDRAHFVEMDLLHRCPVDLCLGGPQAAKDRQGRLALPRRQHAPLDHRLDVVQMPMSMLWLVLDAELQRADPARVHLLHHEGRQASAKIRGFLDRTAVALRAEPALARN